MKRFFILAFCIFHFVDVISQSVDAEVRDSLTQQPIAGASVSINGSEAIVADRAGRFRFVRNDRPLSIVVSAVGYRSASRMLPASDSSRVILLSRHDLFMDPVEVTAIRATDESPFTKTNLTKSQIQAQNLGMDLPFLLNQTPSIIVNSDAGNGIGYTGIRIRGSDATRINMTINGIPYNDAESQGLFFVNLPDLASSVHQVQIQRGVGTSSNGAGAFGATMNFSTNEVRTEPYLNFNNSFGSFNTWKNTLMAGTGLLQDHFTVDARVSRISSEGYVERARTNLHSLYLSTAYLSRNTSVRFNFISGSEETYQAWYGVTAADLRNNRRKNYAGTEKPGEPYNDETDNYRQDHYQLFLNHSMSDRLKFNTAFFFTKGKGYYEQYKAEQNYSDYGLPDFVLGDDTAASTDLIRRLWLDNSYYGQIFSLQYNSPENDMTFGGGWNVYEGRHFGDIVWAEKGIDYETKFYDLPANKKDINVYGKYERKIGERMIVFSDIQYRYIDYRLSGFRNNPSLSYNNRYHFFNPKAGISYIVDRLKIYGSYSQGNKEPNRDDFEAASGEQPRPERLHDFELGIESAHPRYEWAATAYYMKYRDQLVLTGKINDVGAYTRTNIPDSYRIGLELSASLRLVNWLRLSGNLTVSDNRIKNYTAYFDDYDNGGQKPVVYENTRIAYSPAVVGFIAVDASASERLQFNVSNKYVSRQYLDNTSNLMRSLDSYFVQDVRVGYRIAGGSTPVVRLVVQVNNVLNVKYEPNGYTYSYYSGNELVNDNYYFPMAGTNFIAAVQVELK
jgi:iron complex outermembrane recepter protein